MKCTTNNSAPASRRRSRGTAEIELMLVIPLLLSLLFITKGTLELGEYRMRNAFDAEQTAYTDAIHSAPPQYTTGSLQPIDGFADVRPGLPNRMHDRDQTVTVKHSAHVPLASVNLTDSAAFAAPAWAYSAFPVKDAGGDFDDATATQDWFSDYAGEVRGPLEEPLGLSPSSPP